MGDKFNRGALMVSTYITDSNLLIVLNSVKYFNIVREGVIDDTFYIYANFSHVNRVRIFAASTEAQCKDELTRLSEVLRLWD